MLTNKEIENVSAILSQRMENVTQHTLDLIAKRINKIGGISPSDAHRISKLKNIGGDLEEINRYLANATNMNIKDIEAIYKKFGKDSYDFTKPYYDATGTKMLGFEDNVALQRIIKSQMDITQNSFKNISKTTAFALKDKNGNVVYRNIDEAYKNIVDEAITSIQSGVSDYQSNMRSTLKQYADSGIRTVNYESGTSRDIYSAVRMNILDGVRQMNMSIREQTGKEFGADGFEVSVHGLCAPDHLDIQGQQYSKEDFEKLNASLDRPIGCCNCQHSIFPIILGISNPVYSREDLENIKSDNENKSVTIDGNKYTKYEASQLQRRCESEIRKAKREYLTLKNAGDDKGALIYKNRMRELNNKYSEISNQSGLTRKNNRLTAYGDEKNVKDLDVVKYKEQASSIPETNGKELSYEDKKELALQTLASSNISPEERIETITTFGSISRKEVQAKLDEKFAKANEIKKDMEKAESDNNNALNILAKNYVDDGWNVEQASDSVMNFNSRVDYIYGMKRDIEILKNNGYSEAYVKHEEEMYQKALGNIERQYKESKFKDDWQNIFDSRMKYLEIKEQVTKLTRLTFDENISMVRDVLSSHRELGGSTKDIYAHLNNSRSPMKKVIEQAYQLYPKEWVENSINFGNLTPKSVNRGYYNHFYKEIAISGSGREALTTSVHELGHRFEKTQDILKYEKDFYEHRTKGEDLVWLGGGYAKNEKTRVDNWLDTYMGKDYGGSAYEIVSMGFQMAYTDIKTLMMDEEYADFIFGLLTLA